MYYKATQFQRQITVNIQVTIVSLDSCGYWWNVKGWNGMKRGGDHLYNHVHSRTRNNITQVGNLQGLDYTQ